MEKKAVRVAYGEALVKLGGENEKVVWSNGNKCYTN